MEKIYGATAAQDGLYKIGRSKYELIYGYGKDSDEQEFGWNYRQRFTYQPSLDEIKKIIFDQIDAETDEKILNGFVYDGISVVLSAETQFNFLGTLMNIQGGGVEFPKTFKLGETEDGTPLFHDFVDAAEFVTFCGLATKHKEACYSEGWAQKAAFSADAFELQ